MPHGLSGNQAPSRGQSEFTFDPIVFSINLPTETEEVNLTYIVSPNLWK